MKRIILCLAILLTASSMACAFEWSLDSCINYATSHNITIKMSEASRMQAEQSVIDAQSRYLPSVNAGAGQSWNLGRGLTAENTYADRNTSSFNWNASLNLPLFSGLSTQRQVAYAKANLLQIAEQYEAAKEDITINVIGAYLQALYTKEICEVAANQVALSEYELERQQALLDAGKIPEIDLLEAKSQLANDKLQLTQAINDVMLARLDLAQILLLETEDMQYFDIAPLSQQETLLPEPDEAYARALQFNHSIAAKRRGVEASDKNISLAKSGYLPTLSFNAGLGSSYYNVSGYPNENFADQMKHNYSTYFGFQLNIPIFDAFSTRNNIRRAQLQKYTAELEMDQAEQQLYRNIQQAYFQATAAKQKMESSETADNAAQAAFMAMQEKYNIGRATPQEYEQSKNRALRTTAELIQAKYEYQLRSRLLTYYSTPH